MTLSDAVKFMVDNHYLIVMEGEVIVTAKLRKALCLESAVPIVVTHESVATTGDVVTSAEAVKTVKKKLATGDLKEIWNKFIEDAEIPWKVTNTAGHKYTIRQYGPTVAMQLKGIIQHSGIDYNTLVEATKNYYRTTTYKAILSNYILKEIWRDAYNDYVANGKNTSTSGGNRFED